jgi:Trk K+ transport system NAD-binding subunit
MFVFCISSVNSVLVQVRATAYGVTKRVVRAVAADDERASLSRSSHD